MSVIINDPKKQNESLSEQSLIKKVVVVKIERFPLTNELLQKGWKLLKITDSHFVLGHRCVDMTIPQLGVL